jgi:hypothetical protein
MESVDWINPAQDRNRWRAVVNALMDLSVPYHAKNFLIENRFVSQGLSFMEAVSK